jgi:DNA-binding NarL/FixJ family response regulator
VGTAKAKVMLVDDHAMLRHGMEMLINREPDMEVSAEVGDAEEALAILKAYHQPDIILMDVSLKTHSGFELTRKVRSVMPKMPVLVVSMHDEAVYAERALRAGAQGYVMKQEPGKVLVNAIREVLKGNLFLNRQIQARLLKRIATGNSDSQSLISTLTPAEFEVLHLIGAGHSSQQIASLLNRSIKTVDSHRYNIRIKLNLKDAPELIRFAIKWVSEGQ